MFDKILVALDGSPASDNALHVAVDEARVRNAELHVLYVVQHVVTHSLIYDGGVPVQDANPEIYNEIMENEAKNILERAGDVAKDDDIDIRTHMMFGDPRDVILDFSEELGVDLIIVGSAGKSNLDRLLLGSVSSAIIQHSKITTIVVRS